MRESKRYLGLELAGAKNQKTSLAVLEYYPKEKKLFVLDVYDKIATHEHQTGDEALLELIDELGPEIQKMGINVPLELPPCISCTRKTCPLPEACTVTSVKWMKETLRKASRHPSSSVRVREFTPYTQRPIEIWARYQVLPHLPKSFSFDIDETLGGNKAPLTARMSFLKRHLSAIPLLEVWPKLSVALLGAEIKIPSQVISKYRQLDEGIHAREEILIQFAKQKEIFIYERDARKLAHSLSSFDAFICAYTAILSDQGLCTPPPKGFPAASGWVEYPEIDL